MNINQMKYVLAVASSSSIREAATDDFEGKVKFAKANVEDLMDLAQGYGVMNIPTLLLFKNGEKVVAAQGLQNIGKIRNIIEQNQ